MVGALLVFGFLAFAVDVRLRSMQWLGEGAILSILAWLDAAYGRAALRSQSGVCLKALYFVDGGNSLGPSVSSLARLFLISVFPYYAALAILAYVAPSVSVTSQERSSSEIVKTIQSSGFGITSKYQSLSDIITGGEQSDLPDVKLPDALFPTTSLKVRKPHPGGPTRAQFPVPPNNAVVRKGIQGPITRVPVTGKTESK